MSDLNDLPPEPGTVPDLDHGIPGPPEDLSDDDAKLGEIDADEDDGDYDDTDDEPDQVGPDIDLETNPDDGLDEPDEEG